MTIPTVAHSEMRPESALWALMECEPFQEPDPSRQELSPLREALNDAIENVLDPRERWVFDALVVERQTLRALGRELSLSKTHVARLRDEIIDKLQRELVTNGAIAEYLGRRG